MNKQIDELMKDLRIRYGGIRGRCQCDSQYSAPIIGVIGSDVNQDGQHIMAPFWKGRDGSS